MKKLCKCGCGQAVRGHFKHRKFVESDYLSGHNRRGYKASKKTIQKLIDSHKGQRSWNKGKKLSDEHIRNLRIARATQDYSHRLGIKHKPESIEKMRIIKLGKKASQSTKDKMRAINKRKWEDPAHAKKMIKSWKLTPNKKEIKLMEILDSLYPEEWKFVGNGDLIIDGKCPDFVNCNGQKKIIELFGDYWHKGENPQDRIDIFKPFGYSTLVIWERELKNMDVLIGRIRGFVDEVRI